MDGYKFTDPFFYTLTRIRFKIAGKFYLLEIIRLVWLKMNNEFVKCKTKSVQFSKINFNLL